VATDVGAEQVAEREAEPRAELGPERAPQRLADTGHVVAVVASAVGVAVVASAVGVALVVDVAVAAVHAGADDAPPHRAPRAHAATDARADAAPHATADDAAAVPGADSAPHEAPHAAPHAFADCGPQHRLLGASDQCAARRRRGAASRIARTDAPQVTPAECDELAAKFDAGGPCRKPPVLIPSVVWLTGSCAKVQSRVPHAATTGGCRVAHNCLIACTSLCEEAPFCYWDYASSKCEYAP